MKQSRLMQKVKRFMTGVVALAMTVTMFPAASATAAEPQEKYPYTLFAASDAEGAITITGNACVNGNIATNGTTVFTGNTINRNGTITEQVNENVIDISAMLDELYFAGKNVTNLTENYVSEEMNCNISNPTVVQGTMEVKGNVNLNASVKVSEDITIEADSLNANNAVLYSENGDIFISGNNVNFTGLLYAPEGDVTITAQHVNLNSIIVIADTVTLETGNANINYNPNMAEIIGANSGKETTEPDIEATVLFLLCKFNAENQSVDMEWYTNAAEADVTVWTSTDNVAYEQEATVTGVTTYQYVITEEFETRYFKASVTDEQGNTVETAPFVVAKTENGYFVSPLDSDKDGIADEYELLAGTDVNNPDTDGDTLTDYEELYISHTDATKYDSVTEGLSDAEADSDGDRLSNREEIEYATDVQNADTDNDTLTDYEEIVVYNTDPLKADTDGDTLKDGDEIALGLDPLNPKTFGVPDAEYMVEQTISADSEALEEINTDENEYRLAVDVTASGYVEGNLTAKETGYATAIQNEFMVGIASELSYTNEDGIESVTLTFELDDEVIEDSLGLFPGVEELSGIKRFNVFKYFEELNMLLPIETVVDEENNRIYATTDELGTYCVMDMELWLASFDVPEEVYMDTPATFSLRADATTDEFDVEEMLFGFSGTPEEVTEIEEIVPFTEAEQEVPMLFALNRPTNVTPIDVAFLLQSSGQLPDTFTTQKAMLVNLLGALSEEFGEGNVRFTVINYNLYGAEVLETETGTTWFVNDSDLYSVLDTIEYQYTYDYTDRGNAFETLQKEVEFKENAAKFIFQVMNGSTGVGYQYFDQINTCTKLGINYSELVPEGYFYLDPTYGQQVADAIASTNGMNVTYGSTTPYEVYTLITYAAPPQVNFEAFIPSGWKKIVLDGILDPKNGVNSDTDDLTDWEEVNTELLSWDTDGTVILPTMKDFIYWVNKPYAEAGVERYLQSKSTQMSPINFDRYVDYVRNSMRILPIHSDPTLADSDDDGLEDSYDPVQFNANNKGFVMESFSKIRLENLSKYNTVIEEYSDIRTEEEINQLCLNLKINVKQAVETCDNITLLQKCLEYLNYLNMYEDGVKVAYGTFGGKTVSALQLFQINYGYEPIDNELKDVDTNTYQTLLNVAINNGYLSHDSIQCENIYNGNNIFKKDSKYYKKYFSDIPSTIPKLSEEQISEEIDLYVMKDSIDYDRIYCYDYSTPLNQIVKELTVFSRLYCAEENIVTRASFFYGKVNHEEEWDVKRKESWEETIPNIEYYSQKFSFAYNDMIMNSENLGNFIYGCTGRACGFDLKTLNFFSGYASITGDGKENNEDTEYIKLGYDYYNSIFVMER
ncbi:MAG: polymorphic toxin type 44 domain-containing protein [Lachnospiraceae bacterium]